MTTYFVQATLGNKFEDLYVRCAANATRAQIIEAARKVCTINHRFVNFVL